MNLSDLLQQHLLIKKLAGHDSLISLFLYALTIYDSYKHFIKENYAQRKREKMRSNINAPIKRRIAGQEANAITRLDTEK